MTQVCGPLYTAHSSWLDVVQSPRFLLHSIDVKAGTFGFVKTSRETLSGLSFLDGRSALGPDTNMIELPMDEVLSWDSKQETLSDHCQPHRFIFHTSFCGSTLMARVFDIESKCFTYREPQIFMQLASIKAADHSLYRNKRQWRHLLSFVLGQFQLPWSRDEINIIKPSNWGNSILAELSIDAGDSRAVMMSMSERRFLLAAFRGGGERLQYIYSVLENLLTAFPEFKGVVVGLKSQNLTSEDLFARFTLINLKIQKKAYKRLARLLPVGKQCSVTYEEFLHQPERTSCAIAKTLDLPLCENEVIDALRKTNDKHSKMVERAYSASASRQVDQQVSDTYQNTFDSALEWAENGLIEPQFS